MQRAQERLGEAGPGGRPRYVYVMADFYQLPFARGLFDAVVIVRTLHHAADAAVVLQGAAEILAPSGDLILEFANKRNLKAILRYWLRRQSWSPFALEPVEFVELHWDFHPRWVRQQLAAAELQIERVRTVSHFRLDLLKRVVPTGLLVAMDRLCQQTGALWQLTPSVFVRAAAGADKPAAPAGAFFRCADCGSTALVDEGTRLCCADCGAAFELEDGIYNFRGEGR